MALGRNFAQALQKALRSVEQKGSEFSWPADTASLEDLLAEVARPHDGRLQKVQQALWLGASVATLYEVTAIDPWFLEQIVGINAMADRVRQAERLAPSLLRKAKENGFSDAQIAASARKSRGRDPRGPPCAGYPSGVQDRGHVRGGVPGLHALPLLQLRHGHRG